MSRFKDIQLRNKERGDTIYYRNDGLYTETNNRQRESTLYVTNVNDNYIYARGSFDKHSFVYKCKYKFRLDNGIEISNKGNCGQCYSSKEFYELENKAMHQILCMIDEFENMHNDSDMRLVNAMYELMNNWEG